MLKYTVKAIAFDVNGTLADDTVPFLWAINGIFSKFGKRELPLGELKKRFGQPWTKIYREEGISEEMASEKELYEMYNELYLKQGDLDIFPGLKESLKWLRQKNIMLAVVSTQQNLITESFLKRHGLFEFFSFLEGGTGDKSGALEKVFKYFDVEPKEVAYVGDQEGDIIHAKRVGCISIGFVGGLHDAERLLESGPDYIINAHEELRGLPIF